MKKTICILGAIAIFIPILGCGSFTAHCRMPMSCQVGDPRNEAPTPIYGGVAYDCIAIGDCIKAPIPGIKKNKNSEEWWNILFIPLPIIDLPLSLISDTIFLPWDIDYWEKWSEMQEIILKNQQEDTFETDKNNESYQNGCRNAPRPTP